MVHVLVFGSKTIRLSNDKVDLIMASFREDYAYEKENIAIITEPRDGINASIIQWAYANGIPVLRSTELGIPINTNKILISELLRNSDIAIALHSSSGTDSSDSALSLLDKYAEGTISYFKYTI